MNGEVIIGIPSNYKERQNNYKEAKNLDFLLV